MNKKITPEVKFSRGEVARILNVHPLTIANREKRKQYPEPRRDLNGYRIYSLQDVFNLQLLTSSAVDPRPIISVLYDKGMKDQKMLGQMMDTALSRYRGSV